MWSRKVFPYAQQRETEGPVIVVDLDSAGRRDARRRPRRAIRRVDALRLSGQARDQRARAPEAPADGRQSGRAAARPRLQRRAMHDAARASRCALVPGAAPRGRTRRATAIELCAGGLGGRVLPHRRPHVRPQGSAAARLSFQGAQHLQTLGRADRLRPRARGRRAHVGVGALEGHLRVARGGGRAHRRDRSIAGCWTSSSSCATRSACASGCVTPRRARTPHGELALSLTALVGRRRGRSPCGRCRRRCSEDPPLPALLLAETPDDKPSLILPPRTFNPSRVLRSLDSGPERRFRLTRLVQRGADFERVAFEEMTA